MWSGRWIPTLKKEKNCYLQLQVKTMQHHIPEDGEIKKSLFKFYVSHSSHNSLPNVGDDMLQVTFLTWYIVLYSFISIQP